MTALFELASFKKGSSLYEIANLIWIKKFMFTIIIEHSWISNA